MSRLVANVPTVRQRQEARSNMRYPGGGQTTIAAPFALNQLGAFSGPLTMRTRPSLGQQAMAARYGATGLAGPTYASVGAGLLEPANVGLGGGGVLPNYATLKALAMGYGRRRQWARGELQRRAVAERRRLAREAELARRRGALREYANALQRQRELERMLTPSSPASPRRATGPSLHSQAARRRREAAEAEASMPDFETEYAAQDAAAREQDKRVANGMAFVETVGRTTSGIPYLEMMLRGTYGDLPEEVLREARAALKRLYARRK